MKYFLLSSLFLACLFPACKSAYSSLEKTGAARSCALEWKPVIHETIKYSTQVKALNNEFSGILLFKPMSDSSLRIVFTNQFGIKFFDFEFAKNGDFVKHFILPQMDKDAVVNLLRKDFEMLLMKYDPSQAEVLTDGSQTFSTFALKKGKVYYVTTEDCSKLMRIENGSNRKPVIQIFLSGEKGKMPETFLIEHKKVAFTIQSKRLTN
jgi:hypothetical protein